MATCAKIAHVQIEGGRWRITLSAVSAGLSRLTATRRRFPLASLGMSLRLVRTISRKRLKGSKSRVSRCNERCPVKPGHDGQGGHDDGIWQVSKVVAAVWHKRMIALRNDVKRNRCCLDQEICQAGGDDPQGAACRCFPGLSLWYSR